jgi:glycosyl transferase family 25
MAADHRPQLLGDERPHVRSIPAFFINRTQDGQRRTAMLAELHKARLAAERVRGIDGLAVPSDLRPYFFDGDRLVSRLSAGEVGCYASHLAVAKLIYERQLDFGLVLEDDAILPADLASTISEVLDKVAWGWDFIQLGSDPRHAVKPIAALANNRALVQYSRLPAGAIAYLISADGARKFLAPFKRQWPVDTDFRQPWMFDWRAYGVAPKLIDHNSTLASAVLERGERSRLRRGFKLPSTHNPTGNPLHTPEGAFFNLRRLGVRWWSWCTLQNAMRRLGLAHHRP